MFSKQNLIWFTFLLLLIPLSQAESNSKSSQEDEEEEEIIQCKKHCGECLKRYNSHRALEECLEAKLGCSCPRYALPFFVGFLVLMLLPMTCLCYKYYVAWRCGGISGECLVACESCGKTCHRNKIDIYTLPNCEGSAYVITTPSSTSKTFAVSDLEIL